MPPYGGSLQAYGVTPLPRTGYAENFIYASVFRRCNLLRCRTAIINRAGRSSRMDKVARIGKNTAKVAVWELRDGTTNAR